MKGEEIGWDLARALSAPAESLARATHSFTARAHAGGLVDVSYATTDTPLGRILVACSRRGVVRIAYADSSVDDVVADLSRRVSRRVLEAPERVQDAVAQLDEYFEGRRRAFELPLDLRLTGEFQARVLRHARSLPYGGVATYRAVAEAAGSARAVRAAGTALARNPIPIVIPCHRVLRSDGTLGGYAGGLERKRRLLDLEGAAW